MLGETIPFLHYFAWLEVSKLPKNDAFLFLKLNQYQTVHAATVYRPEERPPIMDKSANNRLIYKGNDEWHLMSNERLLKT